MTSPRRSQEQTDTAALFEALRAYFVPLYGADAPPVKIEVWLKGEAESVRLLVPKPCPRSDDIAPADEQDDEAFILTPVQEAILDALDAKALRTDALAAKVGGRSRLFDKKAGLQELRDRELVKHHSRLGFYRPDSPPEQLADHER